MKQLITFILLLSLSISLYSQQFSWAISYEINNCNEVAAMSLDADGNIIITGVHDAPATVPYQGNAYIQKTGQAGDVWWTDYLIGNIIVGDMAAVGNNILIIGQSNGSFTYRDVVYGTGQYFMFALMIDADGNYLWHFTDETKYGVYSNISVGNTGTIALHIRKQSNLGDWIIIIDEDGNTLNSKLLSPNNTLVIDIAYFNDWVYINGGYNGQTSVAIDTIEILQPPVEHSVFVLALDENLVANWISEDTTINNRDGRVVVNEAGIFSYQDVLRSPFTVVNLIKKFDFEGQLLTEVEAPFFTTAITPYPDMVVTPSMVALFNKNSFNSDSHEVMLFDHDLNILAEKAVDGASSHYSGQIANRGDDVFVAQVFSGSLNFSNELTLAYPGGTGNYPYIAEIVSPDMTGIFNQTVETTGLSVYPNPADEIITVVIDDKQVYGGSFSISDLKGNVVISGVLHQNSNTIDVGRLSAGVYLLQTIMVDGSSRQEKIFVR
jgi:hypothetical protein